MYGEDLRAKFPAVGAALRGEATKDIWTLAGSHDAGGGRPIVQPDGTLRGALLVGYVLTARDAQVKHDLLGTEIAYFHDGKVHTSSFISEGTGDSAKEDGNKIQPLNQVLFQSPEAWGQKALQKGAPTEIFHVMLDGREYAAVAAPLHGNAFDKTSGVVTLASISDALDPVSAVGVKLIGFGVLAILVLLGAVVMTSLRFIKPLDKIELGVAEIINGNIDYQFKPIGPDFEGLSNGLNVMLARLLGREEPNEDEPEEEQDETSRWRSDQMLVEEGSGPAGVADARRERARAGERARLLHAHLQRVRRRAQGPGQAHEGDHHPGVHRQAAPHRGGAQAEVEGLPDGALQGEHAGRGSDPQADTNQLRAIRRAGSVRVLRQTRIARRPTLKLPPGWTLQPIWGRRGRRVCGDEQDSSGAGR